jgi:hypothetical protein
MQEGGSPSPNNYFINYGVSVYLKKPLMYYINKKAALRKMGDLDKQIYK